MKLNTCFDMAFSIVHTGEPEDVPLNWLIRAARARLDAIEKESNNEAFGIVDTYEEES